MTLERRVWRLANLIAALLVLVSARIVYWQLVRGAELQPVALNPVAAAQAYEELRGEEPDPQEAVDILTRNGGQLEGLPQPVIQRTIDLINSITRGSIYDRSGRTLAADQVREDGSKVRVYNEPSLAHALGYVSGIRTGISGLERHYNDTLLGLDRPDVQFNQIIHQPVVGSDLVLTIDSQVQRAAERALGERTGAVVVLNGHTGAVLAMVSGPRFDPNLIIDPEYTADLLAGCGPDVPAGSPTCPSPLLNRAAQGLYIPGSTWKTVTLMAALDTGQVTPQTVFDFGEPRRNSQGQVYYVYEVDGGVIPDPNHKEDKLELPLAYARSANAAFARMGDEMPPEVFLDYARRLGFSREDPFPLEIEYSPAQLATPPEEVIQNNLLRAATAIGQGELQVSPLGMAMVVLPVLNDGDLPLPYLVESIHSPSGRTVDSLPNRRVYRDLIRPETARQVHDIMIAVVKEGSGRPADIPGATVGGKTGTAQVGGAQEPHAWFVGYAERGDQAVVVAVLIENAGQGSAVASPVFAEVAQAALERLGEPVEAVLPTPVPPTPLPTLPIVATPTQPPPEEAATATVQAVGNVPPPDIPRDPDKADLNAGQPSCQIQTEGPLGTGNFIWPSQYQALSGTDFEEGHPGIDLSTPEGTPVYAADAGLVIFAGWTGGIGYGNAVLIDHGNGYQTLYAHLSQVSTHCGAKVQSGKLIGLAGDTGNSSGPHLHFEVRVPGGYLNPLRVLPTP
jgi:peptidoglycan glycosyltransferase